VNELKPCPFCGNETPTLYICPEYGNDRGVDCKKCDASTGSAKEWNTRTQPKQPSDDEIEDFLSELGGEAYVSGIVLVRAALDKWGR
jgi:hypothetical protein